MRSILFSLALLWTVAASAEGVIVGPDCLFTWTHAAATASTVTSSTLYVSTQPDDAAAPANNVGNITTTTCNAIGISLPGQYYARVTATNVVGEGLPSTEVPFELVDVVPGAPSLTVDIPTSG